MKSKNVGELNGQYKHGQANTRLYRIWDAMKTRCTNPNSRNYANYGARGISICPEWMKDFKAFYDWAIENGYADDLSIDRIDNNGNYEPSNCRWASKKEQSNNSRRNVFLTYKGKTQTLAQWCDELGFDNHWTICKRIKSGWSIEKALSTPIRKE